MTATIDATEAGTGVEELMRRVVDERAPIVVAREGEPQVVVLPVAEYERLGGQLAGGDPEATSEREDWWELARQSRERIRRERGGRPMPSSENIGGVGGTSWRNVLAATHEQIRREGGGRLVPPPEEVIREMREERDAQLRDNVR